MAREIGVLMVRQVFKKITSIVSAFVFLALTHGQIQAKVPIRSTKSTVRIVKGGKAPSSKKVILTKKVVSRKPTSVKRQVTATPRQRAKTVAPARGLTLSRKVATPPMRAVPVSKAARAPLAPVQQRRSASLTRKTIPTKAAPTLKQATPRAKLTNTRQAQVKQTRSISPVAQNVPAVTTKAMAPEADKINQGSVRPTTSTKTVSAPPPQNIIMPASVLQIPTPPSAPPLLQTQNSVIAGSKATPKKTLAEALAEAKAKRNQRVEKTKTQPPVSARPTSSSPSQSQGNTASVPARIDPAALLQVKLRKVNDHKAQGSAGAAAHSKAPHSATMLPTVQLRRVQPQAQTPLAPGSSLNPPVLPKSNPSISGVSQVQPPQQIVSSTATSLTPVKPSVQSTPAVAVPASGLSTPAQQAAANTKHAPAVVQTAPLPKLKSPLFTQKIDQAFLQGNFVKNHYQRFELDLTTLIPDFANPTPYITCDLGYAPGQRARTEQYSQGIVSKLPAAPVLYPYDPIEIAVMDTTTPIYSLNARLPAISENLLPDSLKQALANVMARQAINHVVANVVVQDMPWKAVKGFKGKGMQVPLLLRPLHACFPDEPMLRNKYYENKFSVKAAVFSSTTSNLKMRHLEKDKSQSSDTLIDDQLNIHNNKDKKTHKLDPYLVSSGATLLVDGIDKAHSHAFYSLTIFRDIAFIAKNLVVTEADRVVIDEALQHSQNLNQFRTQLNQRRQRLSAANFADEFRELWEQ